MIHNQVNHIRNQNQMLWLWHQVINEDEVWMTGLLTLELIVLPGSSPLLSRVYTRLILFYSIFLSFSLRKTLFFLSFTRTVYVQVICGCFFLKNQPEGKKVEDEE